MFRPLNREDISSPWNFKHSLHFAVRKETACQMRMWCLLTSMYTWDTEAFSAILHRPGWRSCLFKGLPSERKKERKHIERDQMFYDTKYFNDKQIHLTSGVQRYWFGSYARRFTSEWKTSRQFPVFWSSENRVLVLKRGKQVMWKWSTENTGNMVSFIFLWTHTEKLFKPLHYYKKTYQT